MTYWDNLLKEANNKKNDLNDAAREAYIKYVGPIARNTNLITR